MIVKQGVSVTDAGRGELNSAYSGLGTIIGVAMPLVWSRLYGFFSTTAPASASPWARVWRPGAPPSPPPPGGGGRCGPPRPPPPPPPPAPRAGGVSVD
jgi:hypothetical protein